MDPAANIRPSSPAIRITSYVLAGIALVLVLGLRLLPALFAGLLVYELVQSTAPLLGQRVPSDRARVLVVALLGTIVVGLLVLLILGAVSFLRTEIGNPEQMWQEQLMPLVEKAREQLPGTIVGWLPDSVDDLRLMALELTRKHSVSLQTIGKEAARVFVHILIGMVLGAIVALSRTRPAHQVGPLASALGLRAQRLAEAFHNIVFAQIKISLLNTAFTAIFLLGVLPLMDIHVPLAKTLVVVTFIVGLLPVIGNLISNTAITIAGLSISLGVGVAALGFLILIHKLEYFLNAHFVGSRVDMPIYALLGSMLVLEAAFGVGGIVAAPIYCAWLTRELRGNGWI